MNGTIGRGSREDWAQVEPMIEDALSHSDGEMTAFDVRRFLDSGDMQLWVAKVGGKVIAAALTEIKNYPRLSVLLVHILKGDGFDDWYEPGMRMFDSYRREMGCAFIEMHGREGWMRKLKDWRLYSVSMRYVGNAD